MEPKSVSILGQPYKVYELSPQDEGTMEDGVLGTTDWTTHEIIVRGSIKDPEDHGLANREVLYKSVLRHEIVHAFLFEAGMTGFDEWSGSYATNELIVDWIAVNAPKMHMAFDEAGAL